MRSKRFALVAVLAAVTAAATRVDAQEHIALPAVNLVASSFMDAVGGPGLLVRQSVEVYEAQRFAGSNGGATPGANSLFAFTAITHVAYAAPFKVFGGYWGGEVLVPVVYASVTTPVGRGRVGGVGDITFSPVVWQAPETAVLGRPFFQFVDLDVVAPTGEYKSSALVTAGSNVWSFNPFYSFTWLRAPAHRDRTKRRMPITDFGGCRSHKTAHADHRFRRMPIAQNGASRSPER